MAQSEPKIERFFWLRWLNNTITHHLKHNEKNWIRHIWKMVYTYTSPEARTHAYMNCSWVFSLLLLFVRVDIILVCVRMAFFYFCFLEISVSHLMFFIIFAVAAYFQWCTYPKKNREMVKWIENKNLIHVAMATCTNIHNHIQYVYFPWFTNNNSII